MLSQVSMDGAVRKVAWRVINADILNYVAGNISVFHMIFLVLDNSENNQECRFPMKSDVW